MKQTYEQGLEDGKKLAEAHSEKLMKAINCIYEFAKSENDIITFQEFCNYTTSGKARRAFKAALNRLEWLERRRCGFEYEESLIELITGGDNESKDS